MGYKSAIQVDPVPVLSLPDFHLKFVRFVSIVCKDLWRAHLMVSECSLCISGNHLQFFSAK